MATAERKRQWMKEARERVAAGKARRAREVQEAIDRIKAQRRENNER